MFPNNRTTKIDISANCEDHHTNHRNIIDKMRSCLFILNLFLANSHIIPLTNPGSYRLTKQDINAQSFDVEMWSGGGGGSVRSSGTTTYYQCGQSGSYVRTTVPYDGTDVFINIGMGGDVNKTGGTTSLTIDKLVNITILGGDNSYDRNITEKIFISITNVTNAIKMIGQYSYGYSGGSAPFGGSGAQYINTVGVGYIATASQQPGGGGAGYLKGADGMVVISYHIDQTNTSTSTDNATIPTNDTDIITYQHTDTFTKYWNTFGNNRAMFFDPMTFGMDLYKLIKKDPCTKINSTITFRKYVNDHIQCTGVYCVDRMFKCIRGHSMDCYNVEHIIDIGGPEYGKNNRCKLIIANLVMAWGRWNQENGRMNKDYMSSIAEKTTIYSAERIDLTRRYLEQCGC
jgi:hypothetical protein